MKTILGILIAVLTSAAAYGQGFIQPPSRYNMLTNVGTWMNISSNAATVAANLPATQAPWIPVGGTGFGVGIKAYATNAAFTTNVWFTLQLSGDGVNAITNTTLTVCYLPRGVSTNTYYTNFPISASATLGNIAAVRIKDVMSTNGEVGTTLAGNLFVERIYINTR